MLLYFIKPFLITSGIICACYVGFWIFWMGISVAAMVNTQEEKHDQSRKD